VGSYLNLNSNSNTNSKNIHTSRQETTLLFSSSQPESSSKPSKKRQSSKKPKAKKRTNNTSSTTRHTVTWRVFGIDVDPDSLGESSIQLDKKDQGEVALDKMYLSQPVVDSLERRLKLHRSSKNQTLGGDLKVSKQIKDIRVVRRSLDARKKRKNNPSTGPKYTYVLDVDLSSSVELKSQPGRNEIVTNDMKHENKSDLVSNQEDQQDSGESSSKDLPRVIVVGAGPAGLFCALSLAQSGKCIPVLLERGQSVESRGKDIGRLIHRQTINVESNFAFGEGGAGTWSDGKLTTRIGRNSMSVRHVLETFVKYGAPEKILIDGSPHLGTDNLVKLLRNMRIDLRKMGGEVRFGSKVTKINVDETMNSVVGVDVVFSRSEERGMEQELEKMVEGTEETLTGDAVVLATGHSARDVYEELHRTGIQLEPKGFATGFRIEHPQKVINQIQYGNEWGPHAYSGKKVTDEVNTQYFEGSNDEHDHHTGRLPVSSYRLATDKAFDGDTTRGVYSFCMCPGGQIVPASTDPNEVCVNGMSFSRRDSVWANAALVVTVNPDDDVLEKYREKHGVLAGIAFQRDMERRASEMGGGKLCVPVQRLTDFINGEASTSAPTSSYRLGIKPSPCHEIYPEPLTRALRDAVVNQFEKSMPGFLCEDALLHAVETRTSSPLRVSRDPNTLQAIGRTGLFPAGEGAGFAGGIVSAAVDGLVVAEAVLDSLYSDKNEESSTRRKAEKRVGFEY
jgi:uncharacterized FAD-dependent dehydrogenase